jgi:hypothetical protein
MDSGSSLFYGGSIGCLMEGFAILRNIDGLF